MKRAEGYYWVNYYGIWEPAKFIKDESNCGYWKMYGGTYGSRDRDYIDTDYLDIDETPIRRKYPLWATWAMIVISVVLIVVSLYMTYKCNN